MLGFNRRIGYREAESILPENPVSLPYELRTEMTWMDFCNPVNPMGTPRSFVQAMHTALVDGELNYAPDRDAHAFRNAMGEYLGLDSDWLMVGSSTSQMISNVAQAFQETTVGVVSPCPPEYITAICNAGHDFVELGNPVSFATVDAYTAKQKYGPFGGVVLANPAFPSSRLLSRQTLVNYLETCSWVVVDESNIELSFGGESMMPLTHTYRNLVIIRTPSVTFGMPGVPISYLVANPDVVKQIRQFCDGSDVSMFAEVLAKELVCQHEYLEQTHEFLDTEIPWMQCMLSLVPGIRIYPAEGNFVLCEFCPSSELRLGVTGVEELVVRLQLAGFLVRPLNGVSGLEDDRFFSVSVRSRDDNERLIAAMRKIVSTIG
ncbi:MAG: aminotransferase class I/II-fold pyridoxal phosphate-dependent enzyme [Eggerthellaceae bacterium]|nr:aminotransferase class I/II-fold pyridoxal phosphate-dependent enzyme [Eggerthellaceae bacterium]